MAPVPVRSAQSCKPGWLQDDKQKRPARIKFRQCVSFPCLPCLACAVACLPALHFLLFCRSFSPGRNRHRHWHTAPTAAQRYPPGGCHGERHHTGCRCCRCCRCCLWRHTCPTPACVTRQCCTRLSDTAVAGVCGVSGADVAQQHSAVAVRHAEQRLPGADAWGEGAGSGVELFSGAVFLHCLQHWPGRGRFGADWPGLGGA